MKSATTTWNVWLIALLLGGMATTPAAEVEREGTGGATAGPPSAPADGIADDGEVVPQVVDSSDSHVLFYRQPAKNWNEALPVGNGRLGAMVFGDPAHERIQLNEDSMWAGPGEEYVDAKGTPDDLAALRQLIDDDKLAEADRFIIDKFSRGEIKRSHQTLGDLHIEWNDVGQAATDYRRELSLRTALATSSWKRGETTYTQQVFCSHPDEALFIHLRAEGSDSLDFDLALDRPADQGHLTHETSVLDDCTLEMTGQVTQRGGVIEGRKVPDMKGVNFRCRLKVETIGGAVTAGGASLQIRGAGEVFIRLTASTDFWEKARRKRHQRATEGDQFVSALFVSAEGPALDDYPGIAEMHRAALDEHVDDHQSLYNRCSLSLPSDSERERLPTDQRLTALAPNRPDPGLEALLFHYGRYLLIASSRDNGNAANLQGLWNEHILAPWNADYHVNINVQMNYWPAEVTNLAATHRPVFTWMKELSRRGAITAREQYGLRGWMAHHASELRAPATMKSARAQWGAWIHGGGWMCQHVWNHYDYTRDKRFLETTGYPLLAGQARFYLDWLVEKDGILISYPESSPENRFKTADGSFSAICAKAAMGQQIIHEVFTNAIKAAEELGIENELTREITAALAKLDNGLHVGPDGRLLEWDKPYTEAEPGHRHLSHLYAFHPGNSITHEDTPEVLEAVKKTIAFREQHGSVGVGWSRAWAVSIYARLRAGDAAERHLHEMLRTQTLANGFNSVFGTKRPLFQIEANLGATAGVAEMLLQSHGGRLHLLPALPKAWPDGQITGLKARGGHEIDLEWQAGKLTRATVRPSDEPLPQFMLAGESLNTEDVRLAIVRDR